MAKNTVSGGKNMTSHQRPSVKKPSQARINRMMAKKQKMKISAKPPLIQQMPSKEQ